MTADVSPHVTSSFAPESGASTTQDFPTDSTGSTVTSMAAPDAIDAYSANVSPPRRGTRRDGADHARVAERSLRALLGPTAHPSASPSAAAARAAAALETLNTRLAAQAAHYSRLAELEEISAREKTKHQDAVQNIEQSIIQSKIAYARLLEEKDTVSRNLAMARKELGELDMLVSEEREHTKVQLVQTGYTGETVPVIDGLKLTETARHATNAVAEEQKIAMLELQTTEDLGKLKELDEEIVLMTEEMDLIKKKRKDLQQKYSAACDDF